MIPRSSALGRDDVAFLAAHPTYQARCQSCCADRNPGSSQPVKASTAISAMCQGKAPALEWPVFGVARINVARIRWDGRFAICSILKSQSVCRTLYFTVLFFAQTLKQGHKTHGSYFIIVIAGLMARDLDEALHRLTLTHGQHHDTANFQLRQEGAGGILGGCGNDDTVKRGLVGQDHGCHRR